METLANINGNANSNFNNMKNINVTAASQQVAGRTCCDHMSVYRAGSE